MKRLLTLFIVLATISSFASEVDSFTNRYEDLAVRRNEMDNLNVYSHELLKSAIKLANKKESCDHKRMTDAVKTRFGTHFKWMGGYMYKWLMKEGDIDRIITKAEDSIYGDFKAWQSISLAMASKVKNTLGVTIVVDNGEDTFLIGSDKFAHFFNRGYKYYKNYYIERKGIDYTMETGTKSEIRLFGSVSTGVASFGDLAANFMGMRFYNKLTGLAEDVVTGEPWDPSKTYVKCEEGKWVLQNRLDWREIINAGWDEGHNCSLTRNESMAEDVRQKIQELQDKDQNGNIYNCPIDVSLLRKAHDHYGHFYDQVINENGIGSIRGVLKKEDDNMGL